MPAEFDQYRIHLVVRAPDGSPFKAYVDSGGGMNIVSAQVADRLKLAPAGELHEEGFNAKLVAFPGFLQRAGVPAPLPDPFFHGKVMVGPPPVADADLFLGGPWLAGHLWLIDYQRHTLVIDPHWRPSPRDHALALGFKTDPTGRRQVQLPRIVVSVDGQPLNMLLDTGAMARLATDAAAALHVAPGTTVATSFISTTVFDRWHATHPEWRVIDHGETFQSRLLPMIEVPQVRLAGFTVGPVWFVRRADNNFDQMMSPMMDQAIVGAFGGSGLHWFHLALDYPRATAWIRPADPRP